MSISIYVTSVLVDDQDKALRFYTAVLGFQVKRDIPLGDANAPRWITVVGKEHVGGVELLLEPDSHPASSAFKTALLAAGIPATSFAVTNVEAEYERLRGLGVVFTQSPTRAGPAVTAVLDDTCGNLIQLVTLDPGT
jgi:catechol 2,3-dioxygenase-like lactoylglutathione lyase family enzyme